MRTEVAILIAAALATTGWIYTARRARSLAKKQHTINVILKTNHNTRFLDIRAEIAPFLKARQCPEGLLTGDDKDLKRCFRDILNHYEFCAAGLRNGDFDEKLVKDSEKTTYILLFECCQTYIWQLRDSRERMTIYEHLEWVHRRWKTKPPTKFQLWLEWVRGRPFYGRLEHDVAARL